jgi:hypothetical protein
MPDDRSPCDPRGSERYRIWVEYPDRVERIVGAHTVRQGGSVGFPQHDRRQVARLDLRHPLKAFRSVLVEIRFELCDVLRDPQYAVLIGHARSLRLGRSNDACSPTVSVFRPAAVRQTSTPLGLVLTRCCPSRSHRRVQGQCDRGRRVER